MGRVRLCHAAATNHRGLGGSHLRSHPRLQSEGKACWILAPAQLYMSSWLKSGFSVPTASVIGTLRMNVGAGQTWPCHSQDVWQTSVVIAILAGHNPR